MNWIQLIIPSILTLGGNIIFYLIIKSRIDKSIEQYKISYSGIYKEKIEIHKELLRQLFNIKLKLQQYRVSANPDMGNELFKNLNDFIQFYQYNQPFINDKILKDIHQIRDKLQGCFDDFYLHHSTSKSEIDRESRIKFLTNFIQSGNEFSKDGILEKLEKNIINSMKADLKIE